MYTHVFNCFLEETVTINILNRFNENADFWHQNREFSQDFWEELLRLRNKIYLNEISWRHIFITTSHEVS